jgi:hypothetical protein
MKILWLLIFKIIISTNCTSQVIDSSAYYYFKSKLDIIDSCISGKKMELINVSNTISFLSAFTGVSSESNGNSAGQMSPIAEDHKRWSIWLEINKEYIFFDKVRRKIMIKKEMLAY